MITAYVAGYETWAELFRRDTGLLHQKGWHPTGSVWRGRRRRRLRQICASWTPTRPRSAIALGASQSAGLMANFGTMTKPFHAGKAAHAGIMAARLAEAGFTASTDALEHPQGFLHAISPTGTEDRTSEARPGEMGDPDAGPGHQEISHLLLHPPRHRLHARPGQRHADQGGRREEDHRQHQRLFRHRAAQPPARHRARGEVQHGVRDGQRHRREARRPARTDR